MLFYILPIHRRRTKNGIHMAGSSARAARVTIRTSSCPRRSSRGKLWSAWAVSCIPTARSGTLPSFAIAPKAWKPTRRSRGPRRRRRRPCKPMAEAVSPPPQDPTAQSKYVSFFSFFLFSCFYRNHPRDSALITPMSLLFLLLSLLPRHCLLLPLGTECGGWAVVQNGRCSGGSE